MNQDDDLSEESIVEENEEAPVPEALVVSSRTRPALASSVTAPELSVDSVPNALMIEPTDI